MEYAYDKVTDTLYLHFSDENPAKIDEIFDGIIINYSKKKSIVAIEILNFSKRSFDLNKLIEMSAEEIISLIEQYQ